MVQELAASAPATSPIEVFLHGPSWISGTPSRRILVGTLAPGQGPSDYVRDAPDQELNRSRSDRELIDHVAVALPSQPRPGGIQAAPAARVLESGWQLCRLGIKREITGGQAPPRQRRCAYVRIDRTGQASKRNERGMLTPTA